MSTFSLPDLGEGLQEAEIVAAAGQAGRITVATNMAGRGTDIKLDEEVVQSGGLYVIMAERHDAGRIDRQLEGRSGRQGQPGCFQAILSLEDQLLEMDRSRLIPWAARLMAASGSEWLGRFALRRAQGQAGRGSCHGTELRLHRRSVADA